jgi:hypothetical protein
VPWNLSEDHPQLRFIPFDQAEKQPIILNGGSYDIVDDKWWIIHPEKGLCVYVREDGISIPQCNSKEDITKFMTGELMGEWAEAKYIRRAYIRSDL